MNKNALLTALLSVLAAVAVIAAVGVWVKSIREEGEANRRARVNQQRSEEKAELDAIFEEALGNTPTTSGGK